MAISTKSIKLLWANAGGRCSFTDCGMRLTVEQAASSAPYILGEMAHIKGENEGSNRYDSSQTDKQRDSYENLILLCPNHHTLIDKIENKNFHTVDILLNMKLNHELKIEDRLSGIKISNIEDLKNQIAISLAENHQAWMQYGPLSEVARRNPHSDEIHAVWLSERLSTIVPNNRIIVGLLETHRHLFDKNCQPIVSKFIVHAKSYEKWVQDEISYQAVARFPNDFEHLIRG